MMLLLYLVILLLGGYFYIDSQTIKLNCDDILSVDGDLLSIVINTRPGQSGKLSAQLRCRERMFHETVSMNGFFKCPLSLHDRFEKYIERRCSESHDQILERVVLDENGFPRMYTSDLDVYLSTDRFNSLVYTGELSGIKPNDELFFMVYSKPDSLYIYENVHALYDEVVDDDIAALLADSKLITGAYVPNPGDWKSYTSVTVRSRGREYLLVEIGAPLPDKGEDEEPVCPICREDLNNLTVYLSCSHRYHQKCIGEWLSRKSICPYCNQEAIVIVS